MMCSVYLCLAEDLSAYQLIFLLRAQVMLNTEAFFDRPCGYVARSR